MKFRRSRATATNRSSLRRAIASKAKKRFTWVDCLDTQCNTMSVLEPQKCQEDEELVPTRFVLLDNQVLQDKFSDEAWVVRLFGTMTFIPFWDPIAVGSPGEEEAQRLYTHYFFRAGLRVSETTTDTPDGPNLDPWKTTNFTEARFVKIWQKYQAPINNVGNQVLRPGFDNLPPSTGCCSNVTGGASAIANGVTWTITEGAIDTSIETSCEPCGDPQNPTPYIGTFSRTGGYVETPTVPPYRLNLGMRKRMKLRENQELVLWVNYGAPKWPVSIADDFTNPVGFIVHSAVKALIEY